MRIVMRFIRASATVAAFGVLAEGRAGAQGQAPAAPAAAGAQLSQVQIKKTQIAGKFYVLEGQGGAIGVLTGPDGLFMVDAPVAPLTDKIAAAIRGFSAGRIA